MARVITFVVKEVGEALPDLSVGGNRHVNFVPKPPPLNGGHRP
jgi:hypothetical protein